MTSQDVRRQAFTDLIREHERDMARSIWRITRDASSADDALQVAMLTVWQRWEVVVRHPNVRALLLRICIDSGLHIRRQVQRHEKRLAMDMELGQHPASDASASDQLEHKELMEVLLSAVESLPNQQSVCVWMRCVEECEYETIAMALNVSEATVRKHVQRGREKLRQLCFLQPDLFPETEKKQVQDV